MKDPARQGVLLAPGTLLERLDRVTQMALESGALFPIPTAYTFIEDSGVRFFVRVLTSLARKDEDRKLREISTGQGRPVNPFLPYEQALFVADISGSHAAILNKFNVLERHLLLVTREYEDQENLLTLADFEALWACLFEYDSLGFYNGGEAAGASQRHKHLQVVPLPLAPEGHAVPIEPLLGQIRSASPVVRVPGLPFMHAFCRLNEEITASPIRAAMETSELYGQMLRAVNMAPPMPDAATRQSGPYCLLVTRKWMLLAPRSREFFEGISINSLGYAGALLVRNEEQIGLLKKHGPMNALVRAGLPWESFPG